MKQKYFKFSALVLAAALVLTPQSALAAKKAEKDTDKLNSKTEITETAETESDAEKKDPVYEAMVPHFQYDDNASVKIPKGLKNRFVLQDGIYVNPKAEATGKATLMITGDLMCQYRQQEAVFVSDGKDYISYEEHLETRFAAEAAQQAAVEEAMNSSQVESSELGAVAAITVPPLDFGVIPQPTGTWDFSQSFRYAKKILKEGDLVIGNLETMLSQSSPLGMQVHTLEGKPYLNAPLSYLDALKEAGFDMLTLSNNHNIDTGLRGIYETLDNVDAYKFLRTGMFRGEEEDRYIIVNVNGIKIGMVAYSSFFNDKDHNLTETGQEVLLNRYGIDKVRTDIKAAKKAGAEYIIVFMHWGAENTHETTWNQERYAYNIAKAGADYIVGSHPHAIQRYEIIETPSGKEVPVIYSMGNFVSHMKYDVNNDSLILQLNLERGENGKVKIGSQRLYPLTVLTDMTVKTGDAAESSGAAASGTPAAAGGTRTDSYIVVPQTEEYRALISGSAAEAADDLAYMKASLERYMTVFSGRQTLALPYDPYGLSGDAKDASLLSPKGASSRFQWVLRNLPVA